MTYAHRRWKRWCLFHLSKPYSCLIGLTAIVHISIDALKSRVVWPWWPTFLPLFIGWLEEGRSQDAEDHPLLVFDYTTQMIRPQFEALILFVFGVTRRFTNHHLHKMLKLLVWRMVASRSLSQDTRNLFVSVQTFIGCTCYSDS